MGLFDWVWGGRGRADSTVPALPGPPISEAHLPAMRQDSTVNPFTGLGDVTRDKGSVARPNVFELDLSERELLALYRRNGISRRIIDVLPDRATRKGWEAPEVPAEEEERLCLYDRFSLGWKMARLWGGALLVLVTEDDIPAGTFRRRPDLWPQQPLDLERVGRLDAIHVYDARQVAPYSYDTDRHSSNYRNPLLWQIVDEQQTLTVHHSRVVWLRGAERPPSEQRAGRWGGGRMPDDSVLQAVWAEVRRLTETMQGGAVLAHEIREKVLKVAGLAGKLTGDEATKFKARMSLMSQTLSQLGVLLIGEGDEYSSRSNSATGWKDLSEGALTMLCGVLGWPRIMLTGDAPGGLSTDDKSGRERERALVNDFQERNRTAIKQVYRVLYASQDGPTRGRAPGRWDLTFRPLDEPSAAELADVALKCAQADQINIQLGVYSAQEVCERRYGNEGFVVQLVGMTPLDPMEEARKAAERAAMVTAATGGQAGPPAAAGGQGGQGQTGAGASPPAAETDPRSDASDGACCVVVPAPEPPDALRAAVVSVVQQALVRPQMAAHVTVLYLGAGVRPRGLAEVKAVVAEEADLLEPAILAGARVRAFPPGPHGTPIVLELGEAWPVAWLHERLLRRLAHLVRARQHRQYRAHVTLGYVAQPLTADQEAQLLALDASSYQVPLGQLAVLDQEAVVLAAAVGGGPR